MKKAIFFPVSCSNIKYNEFESCRSEGRHVINIALGFSLLGYESYIIYNWNLEKPKKIWSGLDQHKNENNVFIYNHPDPNEIYDVALGYDDVSRLNSKNYKNKIVLTYEPTNISKIRSYILTNKLENITIACSHETTKSSEQHKNPFRLKFFPVLFPIPSVNIGFIPYNTRIFENKEINIYVHHSSWTGSATSSLNSCRHKQILILRHLISKFPSKLFKLYIHIEDGFINSIHNPFTKNNFSNNNIEIYYIENFKIHYDGIIELLRKMDLCITVGGLSTPGPCTIDALSLGKPIINVVDGVNIDHNGKKFEAFNLLYKCSENLIMVQESDTISYHKLEKILNNLEGSYNCFRDCIKDFDFYNWKNYVETFLSKLN